MINYNLIKSKLNEALLLTCEVMSESQIEFIRSYIDAGEWGLAVETLSDIFAEDKLPLSAKAYLIIQEVGTSIDLDKTIWETLKPQIIDSGKQI